MKIIFMGTPDFAVPCLDILNKSGHEIVGVFAQPDKPKGRHGILTAPPVKEYAVNAGIPVFQPATLKTEEAVNLIASLNPDLLVVVAYGKILPKSVLDIPRYGAINIHASLLPLLRGAAPIQWSIINGFDKTGVTSMQLDEGLDTGDILLQRECTIELEDTAETLFDKLSLLGAQVLTDTLKGIEEGTLKPQKQDDSISTYASILTKEMSVIDWSLPAKSVYDKIRGMYPWPGTVTSVDGKKIKIISAALTEKSGNTSGEIVTADKKMYVTCGDKKMLEIISLQPENKKAMSATDYINGNSVSGKVFQ